VNSFLNLLKVDYHTEITKQFEHVDALGVGARPSARLKDTLIGLKDADDLPVTRRRSLSKSS